MLEAFGEAWGKLIDMEKENSQAMFSPVEIM